MNAKCAILCERNTKKSLNNPPKLINTCCLIVYDVGVFTHVIITRRKFG
jgi:hypothetical protein